MQTKILLTGGSGLLGTEIQKRLTHPSISIYAPSHSELDITNMGDFKYDCDMVIHGAAYTDVVKAETDKGKCYDLNVNGTMNLLNRYKDTYFVYISTEYCNNPVNFYSYTKLWGEELVEKHPNHLIIRTLFKPFPFPFDKAFMDQYTTGDYVDVITPMILSHALNRETGRIMIGTGRKTIFQLAQKSNPKVGSISVDDIKGVVLPKDY